MADPGTEHSGAHHMYPIPNMPLTASQVQLIPTPALQHSHHTHVPQPHVKIPTQGSHTPDLQTS